MPGVIEPVNSTVRIQTQTERIELLATLLSSQDSIISST